MTALCHPKFLLPSTSRLFVFSKHSPVALSTPYKKYRPAFTHCPHLFQVKGLGSEWLNRGRLTAAEVKGGRPQPRNANMGDEMMALNPRGLRGSSVHTHARAVHATSAPVCALSSQCLSPSVPIMVIRSAIEVVPAQQIKSYRETFCERAASCSSPSLVTDASSPSASSFSDSVPKPSHRIIHSPRLLSFLFSSFSSPPSSSSVPLPFLLVMSYKNVFCNIHFSECIWKY